MPFRTLIDAGYAAYVDENQDCGGMWFFLHVPKTAGSSFRGELARLLIPNHNVSAYDGSEDDFATRRERAVRRFAGALSATRYRFASGHVPLRLMEPILAASRPPKLLTMLRDPIARTISDFQYQSTPQHPDHEAFRARFPTIDAYLDADGERDKMLHFLAPRAGATVTETVDHLLDTFSFVGSIETYDASFATMMDLLDAEDAPSLFLRRADQAGAIRVARTPELDERIRSLNTGDVALYDQLLPHLRTAVRLRSEAAPRLRTAPNQGFSAWRFV